MEEEGGGGLVAAACSPPCLNRTRSAAVQVDRSQTPMQAPPEQDDPSTPQNQLLGLGDASECPGAPRKQRPTRRTLPLSPGAPVRRLSFDDADAPPPLPRPGAAVAHGSSGSKLSKLQKLR
ncbi:hypothetical protein COHA_004973 [Chlorella ohadii]|uniref:Uncharacterized protein n=1 Tax=Chlorella ohadii TaxID=2649997 RepID=A0AAD5H5U9_9CHLO|nr:hypothetical protein COHA_004973 [Chlorella ohadii]